MTDVTMQPKEIKKDIKTTPVDKNSLAYKKEEDAQLVKGIFKCYECTGCSVGFVYRKYKGEKIQKYMMQDNKAYSIPLGVAKHINNDCWHPQHAYMTDTDGKPVQRVSKKIKRFGFQSLEFSDFEDIDRGSAPIIQVENMAVAL